MSFQHDAVESGDDLDLNDADFAAKMANACGQLLRLNNRGNDTRISENYRLVFHIRQEMMTVQPSLELDPEDWFAFRRGDQTPVEQRDLRQLLNLADGYVAGQKRLELEENSRLYEDFVEGSDVGAGRPIFSRDRICTRFCAKNHREDGWFHAPQCGHPLSHHEVCSFFINPTLIIEQTDPQYVVYLRTEIIPEAMIAPRLPFNPGHPHSNGELAQSTEFWMFVQRYLLRDSIPFMMMLNFGAWESAVARNHLGVRRECHGHLHLLFPLRVAMDSQSVFRNRFRRPELYRSKNIRIMTDLVARYTALETNHRLAALETQMGTLINMAQRVFAHLGLPSEDVSGEQAPRQPPAQE